MAFNTGITNRKDVPAAMADIAASRPPASSAPGLLFFDKTTQTIVHSEGGVWVQYGGSGGGVAILQGGNSFGVPVVIGSNDAQSVILRTNGIGRVTISSTGDVNFASTATVTGILTLNERITVSNASGSVVLGTNIGSPSATANTRQVKIGVNQTINTTAVQPVAIGSGHTLTPALTSAVLIGANNVMTNADAGCIMIGDANTMNFAGATTSGGCFAVGRSITITHKYSAGMGQGIATTATNQLVFCQSSGNDDLGGFNEIYFGSGIRSGKQSGNAAPVVRIQAGGAGSIASNNTGSKLVISAGKGAGNSTPPDLAFETAIATVSGTTLQTLQEVGRFKGQTGKFEIINTIKTVQPSANGAGEWALGNMITAAAVLDAAHYVEVSIGGVVYKLALIQ